MRSRDYDDALRVEREASAAPVLKQSEKGAEARASSVPTQAHTSFQQQSKD